MYIIGDDESHKQWSHNRHDIRHCIRDSHQRSREIRRQVHMIDQIANVCGRIQSHRQC